MNWTVLGIVIWYLMGISGFIWWWRKDYDFTIREVPACLFIGLIGIVAWPMGFIIHGDGLPEKIIWKRKK